LQRTILITAGAYIGPELIAEFGRLPPSFLPVGNRRLFSLQHEFLKVGATKLVMSLPMDFMIPKMDQDLIEELGIEIVLVPQGITLAESIFISLEQCGWDVTELSILHGDTVFFDFPYFTPDAIAVGDSHEYYNWAGVEQHAGRVTKIFDKLPELKDDTAVIGGYFNFSDAKLLRECFIAHPKDFIHVIDQYTRSRPLLALHGTRWLDFGHVHTFYRSKCQVTTERSFNALSVSNRRITKSSTKANRIRAEVNWYEKLPPKLRIYSPHFLGSASEGGNESYELEYLFLSSLSDLFVFGALPQLSWHEILESCRSFLQECSQFHAPAESVANVTDMYLPKTMERLEEYSSASGIDLHASWTLNGSPVPSLAGIAKIASSLIRDPQASNLTLIHGDFCFSNILYDFRTKAIRVIDPRGEDAGGNPSLHGDQRYDLAKLAHSVNGSYDFILAGYYRCVRDANHLTLSLPEGEPMNGIQHMFDDIVRGYCGDDFESVQGITVLLFLSMLPLHSDDTKRQEALMANAMRLFLRLGVDH
jgi:hypothetical protein